MPITAVLAVYGETAPPWVGACLESLLSPGGVRDFVLVTDMVRPTWIAWAQARRVSLAVVQVEASDGAVQFRQFADSADLRATARIVAWRMGLRLVAPGGPFVALDVDTLARRPLADLFTEAVPPYFGLAMARTLLPSGRHGYRPAVVAGQINPMVDRYLEDWLWEITRLGVHRTQMRDLYGSLESAAWFTLVSRAEDSGGIILARLPITWCTEAGDPPSEDVGILHFHQTPPKDDVESPTWQAWTIASKRSGL